MKPMTKEIPADHQVFSPAASQIIHIRPVSAAIVTNHSPRMNCLGGTLLLTSMYHRPAVGPITARPSTPENRQVRGFRGLRTGDRVPGQREGGHELEQPLAEQLPSAEGNEIFDDPGRKA